MLALLALLACAPSTDLPDNTESDTQESDAPETDVEDSDTPDADNPDDPTLTVLHQAGLPANAERAVGVLQADGTFVAASLTDGALALASGEATTPTVDWAEGDGPALLLPVGDGLAAVLVGDGALHLLRLQPAAGARGAAWSAAADTSTVTDGDFTIGEPVPHDGDVLVPVQSSRAADAGPLAGISAAQLLRLRSGEACPLTDTAPAVPGGFSALTPTDGGLFWIQEEYDRSGGTAGALPRRLAAYPVDPSACTTGDPTTIDLPTGFSPDHVAFDGTAFELLGRAELNLSWGDVKLDVDDGGELVFLVAPGDGNPRIGRKGGGMSVERAVRRSDGKTIACGKTDHFLRSTAACALFTVSADAEFTPLDATLPPGALTALLDKGAAGVELLVASPSGDRTIGVIRNDDSVSLRTGSATGDVTISPTAEPETWEFFAADGSSLTFDGDSFPPEDEDGPQLGRSRVRVGNNAR